MSNYPPIPQKPSSSRGSSRVSSGGVEREISPRLKKKPHQQISFDHASFLDSLETDEPNSGNQKVSLAALPDDIGQECEVLDPIE